jgi:hypothetical protein
MKVMPLLDEENWLMTLFPLLEFLHAGCESLTVQIV